MKLRAQRVQLHVLLNEFRGGQNIRTLDADVCKILVSGDQDIHILRDGGIKNRIILLVADLKKPRLHLLRRIDELKAHVRQERVDCLCFGGKLALHHKREFLDHKRREHQTVVFKDTLHQAVHPLSRKENGGEKDVGVQHDPHFISPCEARKSCPPHPAHSGGQAGLLLRRKQPGLAGAPP